MLLTPTPPFKEYQLFPISSHVFSGYQIGLMAQKLSTSDSAIVALVVLLPSPCSSGVVRNAVRQAHLQVVMIPPLLSARPSQL